MEEKIEIGNLVPVIATISAGKTSLLNAIFNIRFLEVKSGIGTKFVNIIKYNQNITIPRFYHLIVKKNDTEKNYEFFRDTKSIIIGDEKIKKANMEINKKLKETSMPFEEIFYMTEVGGVSLIQDKEYLKNYSLVDIPGLSEYLSPEKEKKLKNIDNNTSQEKSNQEIENDYLMGIFTIIKFKVNNGIILFDPSSLELVENFNILNKYHSIIKKPIQNYLILFNKIDKVKNTKEAIQKLEQIIMRNDIRGAYLNYTQNTILPCSTFSIKNEINMNNSFKHLMCYYFYNYNLKEKLEDETFLDYLKNILYILRNKNNFFAKNKLIQLVENFLKFEDLQIIIKDIRMSIKKIMDICQQYNNLSLGTINSDNFNENKLYQMLENLKNSNEYDNSSDDDENASNAEESSKKREISISINKLEANIIIICFYYYFKEKKNLPPISQNIKKIIEYFTMENMSSQKDNGESHIQTDLTINNLEKEIKRLKTFYDSYINRYIKIDKNKDNIKYNEEIKKEINNMSKTLRKMHYFYFPIFGMNNVGKSTILNDLIGYDLLPMSEGKTTKRGILIKHWDKDYPEINKVKLKQDLEGYSFEHEAFLAKGINNVKKILESINKEYSKDENDFFYEIYTKIKFFEEYQFPLKLREKICFIDLPGYGTNYKFEESQINSHLLKFCELVIFIFQIIKKETNKKTLNKIIKETKEQIRDKGSKTEVALQYRFMFIHNTDISNESTKDDTDSGNNFFKLELKESKKEIIELCGSYFSETNMAILNSKNYHNYLENLNKFQKEENFLANEKEKYEKIAEDFYKGKLSAKGFKNTFSSYLKDILKDEEAKAITLSYLTTEEIIKKENDVDDNIYDNLSEIVKNYVEKDISADRLKKIVSSLIKIIISIKHSKFLKNSNYDFFSKKLFKFIIFGELIKNKDLIDDTHSLLEKLNNIFIKPSTDKLPDKSILSTKVPELKNNSTEFKNEINNILTSMKTDLIIDKKKQENIVVFSLKKSLDDLKQALSIEKNNIESPDLKTDSKTVEDFKVNILNLITFNLDWLISDNWKIIEAKFRDEFDKRAKNFKETFKIEVNNFENIVKNYYEKIKKIFNDNIQILNEYFDKEELKKKFDLDNYLEIKPFLKNALDKFNVKKTLENVLDDIINEIVEGSRQCITYNNCSSFISYLKLNIFNSNYLYRIIDYMKEESSRKFNKFINDIEEATNDYCIIFLYKFKNLKSSLDKFYQVLINKEDEKYQKEKIEWEKFCVEYEEIRDKIVEYAETIKNNNNNCGLVMDRVGIKNPFIMPSKSVRSESKSYSFEGEMTVISNDFNIYIIFVVIILLFILFKIYF